MAVSAASGPRRSKRVALIKGRTSRSVDGSSGAPSTLPLATSKPPRASPCARALVLVYLLSTNHASLDVGKPPGGMVVGVGMCDGCVLNRSSEAACCKVGRHMNCSESACGAITAASCWWSPWTLLALVLERPNHQHESELRIRVSTRRNASRAAELLRSSAPLLEGYRRVSAEKHTPTRRESRTDCGTAAGNCPHGGLKRRCTNEAVGPWPFPAGGAQYVPPYSGCSARCVLSHPGRGELITGGLCRP